MKTTIELPDNLVLKIKVLAAERNTTLKDIVIQSLQLFTRSPAEMEEKKRKAMVKRLLKAMQASNTEPMLPLTREEIYDRPTKAGGDL
jgi:hypothetical protein